MASHVSNGFGVYHKTQDHLLSQTQLFAFAIERARLDRIPLHDANKEKQEQIKQFARQLLASDLTLSPQTALERVGEKWLSISKTLESVQDLDSLFEAQIAVKDLLSRVSDAVGHSGIIARGKRFDEITAGDDAAARLILAQETIKGSKVPKFKLGKEMALVRSRNVLNPSFVSEHSDIVQLLLTSKLESETMTPREANTIIEHLRHPKSASDADFNDVCTTITDADL